MSDEEFLRNRMAMINNNSHYGMCLELGRNWGVDSAEIHRIIRSYLEKDISKYDILNAPKPPIYIGVIKRKSLIERLEEATIHTDKEENKMKATSTETFKDIIAIDFELQTYPNPDVQDKFIVSATNRDDIFCFVFEGEFIKEACARSGLFTGWEKDQKIKELEKEVNHWKREAADCLRLRDKEMAQNKCKNRDINKLYQELHQAVREKARIAYKYDELEKKYNKLEEQVNKVEPFRSLERTLREKQQLKEDYEALQSEYNLIKAANEAQHKFIKEYAGKGTEVQFNYAIDDAEEVSYVIVDKKEYETLKDSSGCDAMIHGKVYNTVQLVDRILELEKLKTPTIENFADEEPSSRRDILHAAEKCVCGHREQDYGSPESNFQLIADLWNGYLGEKTDNPVISVTPVDVSMMMALMKIARIRNGGGSGDSFVDLAGYAACGGEIWHSNKGIPGDSSQETN